jgi:5,10-methylenetetrahydromethanopterin reductase
MIDLPRIGIRVDGSMTAAECVALAKAADAAGLAGVWFAENAFERGILPAAAACAVATKSVRINAGVFNPYSRHPTMMAMEIGTLDELSNGRVSISIGAGILSATEKIGMNAEKPVPALRDAITIVRGMLQGAEVDHTGAAYSARKVRLGYAARPDIPIYLAGRGNLTVKLAGDIADGLMISNMCSVGFSGGVAELARASAKAAGRSGAVQVIQYMPCAISSDSTEAYRAAKRMVGEMLPRFWALGQKLGSAKEALMLGTGISDEEFASASSRIRAGEDPADVLDDRYAVAFSVCGTPEQCLALAARYKAAGIDEIALTFAGANAADQIAAFGTALSAAGR